MARSRRKAVIQRIQVQMGGRMGRGGGIGLRSVLATVVELHCDTYPSSHKQNYVGCVRSIAPSDYVRMHQSNVADTIWYPFMARPASPVHC